MRLAAIGLVLLLCQSLVAQHKAVCKVESERFIHKGRVVASHGSGAFVQLSSSCTGVLTAKHVVPTSRAWVTLHNGQRAWGYVTRSKLYDLAWIHLVPMKSWGIETMRIAALSPKRGDPVTHVGFGSGQLSTVESMVTRMGLRMMTTANLRGGDSGGPIIDARGDIVSVNSHGRSTPVLSLLRRTLDSRSPSHLHLTQFLARRICKKEIALRGVT